ncbi:hypothetical protein, partial [Enterobacter intestinihominis]
VAPPPKQNPHPSRAGNYAPETPPPPPKKKPPKPGDFNIMAKKYPKTPLPNKKKKQPHTTKKD